MGSTEITAYTATSIPALFEPSGELIQIQSDRSTMVLSLCPRLFEIVGQHAALLQRVPEGRQHYGRGFQGGIRKKNRSFRYLLPP
jgi:hypothetical protein